MYSMLFQVRQQSTHVCQESSMHEQTTAPEEQHRSMLETQWIHEHASMNHCMLSLYFPFKHPCLNLSACFCLDGVAICMLFHELLQSLHVSSKMMIQRRCHSAV